MKKNNLKEALADVYKRGTPSDIIRLNLHHMMWDSKLHVLMILYWISFFSFINSIMLMAIHWLFMIPCFLSFIIMLIIFILGINLSIRKNRHLFENLRKLECNKGRKYGR